MDDEQHNPRGPYHERAPRFDSRALVELKTSWNPFSNASAVLLDLSEQGFKIEFVDAVKLKTDTTYTMMIPLTPFRILSPVRFKAKVMLKWFDSQQQRAGGIFVDLEPQNAYILQRIIQVVSEKMPAEQ